jgi:hypothetical protein
MRFGPVVALGGSPGVTRPAGRGVEGKPWRFVIIITIRVSGGVVDPTGWRLKRRGQETERWEKFAPAVALEIR